MDLLITMVILNYYTQQDINPLTWMRIQLCRVFRKYVSPATPVEMLKKKTKQKIRDSLNLRQMRGLN